MLITLYAMTCLFPWESDHRDDEGYAFLTLLHSSVDGCKIISALRNKPMCSPTITDLFLTHIQAFVSSTCEHCNQVIIKLKFLHTFKGLFMAEKCCVGSSSIDLQNASYLLFAQVSFDGHDLYLM